MGIDLEKGKYTNTLTGEVMPLNVAIERGLIKAEETVSHKAPGEEAVKETRAFCIVGVIHPRTKERLTVGKAMRDGILDQEKGIYNGCDASGRPAPMKISEAIKKGLVIVEDMDTSG